MAFYVRCVCNKCLEKGLIMKKLAIIMFLILATNICFAASWFEFLPKSYIDLSTVQRNGRIVSVWIKELNPGNWQLEKNKKIWFVIVNFKADCMNRKLKIENYTSYDLKSVPIQNLDLSVYGTWDSVVPDTIGETKYNYFCTFQ